MKVAAVQMVSALDIATNIDRAKSFMAEAQRAGVDLIVFPENFLTFGRKSKLELSEQRELIDQLSFMAREYGLWMIGGTLPIHTGTLFDGADSEDGKPNAASVVFDNEGRYRGSYSKIHLFDVEVSDQTKTYRESDRYIHGTEVPVFPSPWGDFGIAICYDIRFSELFTRLSESSCKMIFIPSAFTEKTGEAHWEILVRARAIETQCFVIAANQGGDHENGQSTWGQSMIVNPWGKILSKIDKGEGLIAANIEMQELERIRQRMPIRQHRRL